MVGRTVLDLSDMMLYASCPLKYQYLDAEGGREVYTLDERELVTLALKDTCIKYLQTRGLRKPWTSKHAIAFLSRRWSDYQQSSDTQTVNQAKVTEVLLKAQDRAINLHKLFSTRDEVAAVNMPIERSFRDLTVRDTIDAIIVSKTFRGRATSVELIVLDSGLENPSNQSFVARVRAMLAITYSHRYLLDYKAPLKSYILNVYNGTRREISLHKDHRFNYSKLLQNIQHGIDNKVFYPRPSEETCKYCVYRKRCKWSNS